MFDNENLHTYTEEGRAEIPIWVALTALGAVSAFTVIGMFVTARWLFGLLVGG